MSIEGCAVLLLVAGYIVWVTISRRNWKRRALDDEELLGTKIGRIAKMGRGK